MGLLHLWVNERRMRFQTMMLASLGCDMPILEAVHLAATVASLSQSDCEHWHAWLLCRCDACLDVNTRYHECAHCKDQEIMSKINSMFIVGVRTRESVSVVKQALIQSGWNVENAVKRIKENASS